MNLFNSSLSKLSKSLFTINSDVIVDNSLNGDSIFANEIFLKEKNNKKI